MSTIINFLIKHDWLGHIVEAALMTAVVSVVFSWLGWSLALVFGLGWAVGHFHGREKRDCEVSLGMKPPHLKAYDFRKWSRDQLTDFFPVLALTIIALLAIFLYS